MDLIERYLAAIRRQLPDKQAGDIVNELRDVLLSRVEDQESALGRPLTRAELEALLVAFGHPLTVAGRYRQTQYLIGPEVFPFWWAAVKVMLSIVAAVYLVLIVLGELTHKTMAEFNRSVPSVWYVAVYLFGLITLVCLGIERLGKTRILQRWKPANLPPAGGKRRSRFELAMEMAIDVVFILWWAGLIRFGSFAPYPGGLSFALAPVWDAWRWPILAYFVAEFAANLIALARPGWVLANATTLVCRYLVAIGILSAVIQAGHWVVASSTEIPPHALAMLQTNVDLGMRVGIGLTILGMAVRIAMEGWRLHQFRQAQAGGLRTA